LAHEGQCLAIGGGSGRVRDDVSFAVEVDGILLLAAVLLINNQEVFVRERGPAGTGREIGAVLAHEDPSLELRSEGKSPLSRPSLSIFFSDPVAHQETIGSPSVGGRRLGGVPREMQERDRQYREQQIAHGICPFKLCDRAGFSAW